MVQVELISVGMVENTDEHLMVLREVGGKRILVIGIGSVEAAAIALGVEQVAVPRPMTHDLLINVVHRLQAELVRVVIHDVRQDTFIGQLDLKTENGVIEVDCRSSDAVALAVRVGAPIFASDGVLETAAIAAESEDEA